MIPRWKLPSAQSLQMKVEIYNINWQNRTIFYSTKFNLLLLIAIRHYEKVISAVHRLQTLGSSKKMKFTCKSSGITWNYK